jgi:8-oxo-dGTP diphosphatase
VSNQQSKPPKPILVTAAAIVRQDLVLIARRRLDSSSEPGKWEFPGGKVEFGEHPEACLVREIKEELNLEIAVDKFFELASHVDTPNGRHVILLCYFCRLVRPEGQGEMKLLEVADARWVSRLQLDEFDFAAADIPLVKAFKSLSKT